MGEAIPRLHQAFETRDATPARPGWCRSGTIPTDAKLEHFAGLGVDEVVLRVPSGVRSRGTRPCSTGMPRLVERFGWRPCLTRRQREIGGRGPAPSGRPARRPGVGAAAQELASAVRRLMELTVTSAPAAGVLAEATARIDAVSDQPWSFASRRLGTGAEVRTVPDGGNR